jgi:hypothetical protein
MLIIRRKEPKQKNRNRQKKKQRAARGAVHNHIGRL